MTTRRAKSLWIGAFAWVTLFAFSLYLWRSGIATEPLTGLGYVGLFAVAALSSASLFFPGPSLFTVLMAGAIYSPLAVGVVMGAGAGIGEISGYLAGTAGQMVADRSELRQRLERWVRRWGFLVLFLLAAIPSFVLFDIVGIVAGAAGYDFRKFLLATVLGKIVRFTAGAYAGLVGVEVWRTFFSA